LWIGGSIIVLILFLQSLFFFFGDEILKESILVAFRQYATERFHKDYLPSLDFNQLQLNLLGGNVTVTDLEYQNGLPLTDSLNAAHTQYRFSIPRLEIEGVRLWDIYRRNRLQFDQVYLESPQIAIHQKKTNNPADTTDQNQTPRELIAQQEQRIYQTLSEYVELLAFNRLEISDASFQVDLKNASLQPQDSLTVGKGDLFAHRFTIILEDFHLDSTALEQTERLLFTKNIQIKLGEYRFVLPDSSYTIRADTLAFSTQQKKLAFRELEVTPLRAKDSSNWYALLIPQLTMTQVDLPKMYHEKVVVIDTLLMDQPQIKGYNKVRPEKAQRGKSPPHLGQVHPDTLYALVEEYWSRVGINQFQINAGVLEMYDVEEDTLAWLEVPRYSLSFSDFQLDSTVNQRSVDSLSHVLPMDNILLQGGDIQLWFADRQHYFSADELTVRTDRINRYACDIVLDSARVQPRVDSLAQFLTDATPPRLGYDIRTAEVSIYGVNLGNLSFTKFADVDSVRVRQPEVAVANFSDIPFGLLPRRNNSNSPGTADSDTASNTIKEIFYNWSHARLNLYPVIAPNRKDAWLEQMLVNTLQLDSGFVEILKANNTRTGFIEIAHVGKLFGYYQNVSIGNEAHPLIAIDDTTALSSQVSVFADEVDMRLNNSWFQFPYNENSAVSAGWLEAQEVGLSTFDSRGYVQRVKFWPNRAATRFSAGQMEQLEIPYFAISGINFGELYNLQIADFNQVSMISPTIKLSLAPTAGKKKQKGDFSMPELYLQVEPYLNQLAINKLQIQQATISIESRERNDPVTWFSTSSLSVDVMDFLLDSVTNLMPQRPFYARDARVVIDEFDFSLPVEKDREEFRAERFLYSSYSDQLTIDNLHRTRDSLRAIDNIDTLTVTQLALHRMNFYRYFTEHEMEVEKVIIRRPDISVTTQAGQSEKPSQGGANRARETLQPELYPKIKSVTKGIYVDELTVEEGRFAFLQQASDTLHYLEIDTMLVQAYLLAIDSVSHQREAKMFFADEIDFNIHVSNYLLRLPEAQQSIQFKEAVLTNQEDRISVSGLEIKPYGLANNSLSNFPDKNLLALSTPSLQLVGLDVEQAFMKGGLAINQANIMNPAITLYQFAPDSLTSSKEQPRWSDVAPPFFNTLNIDQINFTNGTVKIFNNQRDPVPAFGAERLDVSVLGLEVDSVSYAQLISDSPDSVGSSNITRKLLLADDLLVRIRDYQIAIADTLYTVRADLISLSTKNPQLEVNGLELVPRIPRYQYVDVFPLQKTRVAAQAQTIRLSDINFKELIKQRHLQAQKLTIDELQIDAFKDARVPRNTWRTLPMHQEMLLDLDFLLTLDTIEVADGFISYAERVPEASQEGIITFDNLNGLLLNATNHPDRLRDSVTFRMEVSAEVMGQGRLKVLFNFPMADENMRFSVDGTLGPMDLQAYNPILNHSAFINIQDGYANSMQFYIQGDRERSAGELRFNYNDLNVMLVDKNKGRPGLAERVGSLIANAFVVKSDNPKAVFFRVGEVEYERDPSRSIFSYWWRSLLSGIKSSIGMQPVAERIRDEAIIEDE